MDDEQIEMPASDPEGIGQRMNHTAWAEQKGMLPKLLGQRLNPLYWRYASALARFHWAANQDLTEAEFDNATGAPAGLIR